jgi:protein gp37
MSYKTGISWTSASWNPVTGCTKVSAGCKHCYAERGWGRLKHLPDYADRAFADVVCHQERLSKPLHWKKPSKIFVNSMSDLFHDDVPDEFIDQVFAVMALTPRHIYQILTKRPERMLAYTKRLGGSFKLFDVAVSKLGYTKEFSAARLAGWPLPNVWLGVSVEDQATADERIPILLQAKAALHWISAEPLIGPIDLEQVPVGMSGPLRPGAAGLAPRLGWVVVGGESGGKARPMRIDWARSLRNQCKQAEIPFFFKQTGLWQHLEVVEDSRNIRADKLRYFPEIDATFHRMVGNGNDELDGHACKAWPDVRAIG